MRIDTDIEGVIEGCAASRPGRRSTWINERIRGLYRDLFELGHCHTVEVWDGRRSSAGSTAWRSTAPSSARACSPTSAMLRRSRSSIWRRGSLHGGFTLLDTQFVTDHLRQFGTVELNREEFHRLLEAALRVKGNFLQMPKAATPAEILAVLDARFSNRVTLGWAEPHPIFIEASTYAGLSRAEQRLAGGCRILASSRAAMATEDAETAHQQDAKEPPFSLSLLTFSSLPSPARAGPLLPPTLPDRASLEPLIARGSFFVWHQWSLTQFT